MRGRWVRVAVAAPLLSGLAAAALVAFRPGTRTAHAAGASAAIEIHEAHGASFVPALEGKRPLFILVLGSDARPGQQIERLRSDSIHIIGVNLASHRASILGFPRDSWVPIPGHGTTKINEAMVFGGPPLLIRTLESLTGIHIDLWMLTSFPGLINIVNGIGGLTVDVPYHLHDPFSHAFLTKGRHHLFGRQALAFSRDRHDVPGGDLSRSKDQGILIVAALTELQKEFAANPGAVLKWISVGWTNVRTDLSVQTLLGLGLTATQIPVRSVNNLVVPATTGMVGAASVVFISSSARALYADMRANGVIGS